MVASSQEKGRDGCFNSEGLVFHFDHNIMFLLLFCDRRETQTVSNSFISIRRNSTIRKQAQQENKFWFLPFAEPAGPEEMVWSLHQTPYSYPVPLPGTLVKNCPWKHSSVSFNLRLTLPSLHLKSLKHICLEGECFMNSCKILFHLAFFL